MTWEIEPIGDSCRLIVTHDQLREGANNQLYGGWPMVLSGLKTLLETGEIRRCPIASAGWKAKIGCLSWQPSLALTGLFFWGVEELLARPLSR